MFNFAEIKTSNFFSNKIRNAAHAFFFLLLFIFLYKWCNYVNEKLLDYKNIAICQTLIIKNGEFSYSKKKQLFLLILFDIFKLAKIYPDLSCINPKSFREKKDCYNYVKMYRI